MLPDIGRFRRTTRRALWGLLLLFSAAADAGTACWQQAGERYQLSPLLLQAVAWQESHFNPRAVNHNKNGTVDIGMMQINSSHIPRLKALGIIRRKEDLFSPCLNIQVGAWLLAQHFRVCGLTQDCLGSYNAGFASNNAPRRQHYARQVIRHWQTFRHLKHPGRAAGNG